MNFVRNPVNRCSKLQINRICPYQKLLMRQFTLCIETMPLPKIPLINLSTKNEIQHPLNSIFLKYSYMVPILLIVKYGMR